MAVFTRATSDNEVVQPALSQAVGYVVVVLIGLIIAFSSSLPSKNETLPNVLRSYDVCHPGLEENRGRRQ